MSGSWLDQLQPASWRGLPFAVSASEYRRGRRFAVHEYPYRPLPWAEDVGRASRVVGFSGFVVGDDCFDQAQALLNASEEEGAGTLVHPSLGTMTVALIEPLVGAERAELGRVVELRFEFMETGTPLYPSDEVSTQSDVSAKAASAQSASASDFNVAAGQDNNGSTTASLGTVPTIGATSTYTDSDGSVTLYPANAGTTPYQADVGSDTVRLWGDSATSQVAAPNVAAAGATGVTPPAGTTFSRFDGIGSLSFGTTGDALDSQVTNQASVNAAVANATSIAQVAN